MIQLSSKQIDVEIFMSVIKGYVMDKANQFFPDRTEMWTPWEVE